MDAFIHTAIILNQQSMDKFEQTVKPGGWLVYDPSGITRHPSRTDINICRIDAIEGAARIGNSKVYNMVVLGGFLAVKPIVSLENVEKGLGKSIPARYSSLIPMNACRDSQQNLTTESEKIFFVITIKNSNFARYSQKCPEQ